MTIQQGTFMTHFQNNINVIKEIISQPAKLYYHLETLKNTHSTLEHLIQQFSETSEKNIKQEVYNKMMEQAIAFQTSWKEDIKILNAESYYSLAQVPEPSCEIPEMYPDSEYDELLQYVNLKADPGNPEDIKMVKKYKNKLIEILNQIKELEVGILNFENSMIRYRNTLMFSAKEALKKMYYSHVSFLKFRRNKINRQVVVVYNDVPMTVEGKQTEIIPKLMRKYLGLE